MLQEKVNVQRGNTKLGKVLNVSLPPGRTCPSQVPCFNQGCYARKFYRLRGACRSRCHRVRSRPRVCVKATSRARSVASAASGFFAF